MRASPQLPVLTGESSTDQLAATPRSGVASQSTAPTGSRRARRWHLAGTSMTDQAAPHKKCMSKSQVHVFFQHTDRASPGHAGLTLERNLRWCSAATIRAVTTEQSATLSCVISRPPEPSAYSGACGKAAAAGTHLSSSACWVDESGGGEARLWERRRGSTQDSHSGDRGSPLTQRCRESFASHLKASISADVSHQVVSPHG